MCYLDSPPQSLQPHTPLWDHQNQLWPLSCLPSLFSLHHRPPATAHGLPSPQVWTPVLPPSRAALTNCRSICPTFYLKILTYRNCERIINCITFHLGSAIVDISPCLSVCYLLTGPLFI